MKRAAILLTVAALLLLVGAVLAADGYDLSWRVIGGGGGHVEAGNHALSTGPWSFGPGTKGSGLGLDGTAGQAVAQTASGGSYTLAAGFWPGIGAESPTPTATSSPPPTATPTSTPTATPMDTPTATPTGSVTPPPNLIYLPLVLKSCP